jgi:hypothetical protein
VAILEKEVWVYDMSIHNRTSGGQNCPYCSIPAKRILIGFNDLWTTHPDIAKLLKSHQNGYKVTAGSTKKEYFRCSKCGNVEQKDIMNVTRQGFSCSKCSDGNSYPEKFMISFLDQLDIEYEKQKVFKWSNEVKCTRKELSGKKRYDFYIPITNSIIEIHGIQHFEKSFATIKSNSVRSLEAEKENDKTKENLAVANGILYITIDARKSSLEWIKISIENSKLSEIYNLSKINWLKCHEFATSNLVEIACNYWTQGIHNTIAISQLMKCTRGTVVIYLKQGAELGWCDYNPKEQMKKSGKNNALKVVQISKEGHFIKEWESISEASNQLSISGGSISSNCNGKLKLTGGFKWMYKEDYDKKINRK